MLTQDRRNNIAPPANKDRALMSVSEKPRPGPAAQIMAHKAAVILSNWMMWVRLLSKAVTRGVSGGELWRRRCATWIFRAATGNSWGWSVRLIPINSTLTPFFWVVNKILTKSAWGEMGVGAVLALWCWGPVNNCASHRVK